jgi:Nucleotidyltransferase
MFHTDLSESQLKQSINAEQALQAFYLSASRAHSYRGGMVWREKNGVDYLVKTAPNGTQRGMGARSPETEQIFSDFKAGKQASEEAARVALHMLDETERMNKALRIGRCPNVIIAILNAIRKANLAEHFMVIGTNALYAYEAQAGVRFQDDVTATLDLDFLERVHDFSVVDQKSFQDGMQGAKHRRAGSPARLCNAADRLKGHLSGTDEIVNTFLVRQRTLIQRRERQTARSYLHARDSLKSYSLPITLTNTRTITRAITPTITPTYEYIKNAHSTPSHFSRCINFFHDIVRGAHRHRAVRQLLRLESR